jgi:hypothetical protein
MPRDYDAWQRQCDNKDLPPRTPAELAHAEQVVAEALRIIESVPDFEPRPWPPVPPSPPLRPGETRITAAEILAECGCRLVKGTFNGIPIPGGAAEERIGDAGGDR